jgi:flagellar biosynthesis chaperone FliJ
VKSLKTLLKLAQRDLEALRRTLAEYVARQTALDDRITGHDQTIAREQALAQKDYEAARVFGGYAAASLVRRRAMVSEREILGGDIDRMRTLINEAHVEVRKFERLLELEAERDKRAADKRENAELDEFATLAAGRFNQR